MLAAITIVSQFFRTSNGVIGPELIRDLGLTPAELGIANGAFFLALGLAQVPVGMAFDRYGPRRTVTGLTVIAVAGALLQRPLRGGNGPAGSAQTQQGLRVGWMDIY